MTKPSAKITIPEVVDRFLAYYKENRAWGSLHIVLDDNNVDNDDVEFCMGWAKEHKDPEGAALAEILLDMSKSQRLRLPWKVQQAEDRELGRNPDDSPKCSTYVCTQVGDAVKRNVMRAVHQCGKHTMVTAALIGKIHDHLKSLDVHLRPITVAGKPYYVTAEELRATYPSKYDHDSNDPIIVHTPDLFGPGTHNPSWPPDPPQMPIAEFERVIGFDPFVPVYLSPPKLSFRDKALQQLANWLQRGYVLPETQYCVPDSTHENGLPTFTEHLPLSGTVRL